MSIEPLSTDVVNFIYDNIVSVEQLEILLLLHGQSDKEWTADEVSDQIRTSLASVRSRMAFFSNLRIFSSRTAANVTFRYAPSTTALASTIDAVSHAYKERRVSVIALIYSERQKSIRAFSDAFRLNQEKSDEENSR